MPAFFGHGNRENWIYGKKKNGYHKGIVSARWRKKSPAAVRKGAGNTVGFPCTGKGTL